jgi:hypothetical protein
LPYAPANIQSTTSGENLTRAMVSTCVCGHHKSRHSHRGMCFVPGCACNSYVKADISYHCQAGLSPHHHGLGRVLSASEIAYRKRKEESL